MANSVQTFLHLLNVDVPRGCIITPFQA